MELRLKDYPLLVSEFENDLDPINLPANVPEKYVRPFNIDVMTEYFVDSLVCAESLAPIDAIAEIEQLMNKWAQSTKRFKDDLING